MSRYEMIDPGTDPTGEEQARPRFTVNIKTAFYILCGIGFIVMLLLGPLKPKAKASVSLTGTPDIARTLTQPVPTGSATWLDETGTPTATATLQRTPTPGASQTPWIITQMVQVTKLVNQPQPYEVVKTQIVEIIKTHVVTQMVTTTPLPTYTSQPTATPWVIVITVVVAPTETPTPTATVEEPTPTASETAAEIIPSETMAAYP